MTYETSTVSGGALPPPGGGEADPRTGKFFRCLFLDLLLIFAILPDSVDTYRPISRRIAPPLNNSKRLAGSGGGEGERGERGGEVADGGSGGWIR